MNVSEMTIEQVRRELRQWQHLGLAGMMRTEAQKERIAELWRRIDADIQHRLESDW